MNTTATTIIAKFPSCAAVARHLNKTEGAVRQWRIRNNIPVKYWNDLISLANEHGASLAIEDFMKLQGESETA
jgi:hypothetical protein